MRTEESGNALVEALAASDLTVKNLWLRYLALGGERTRQELQTYLSAEIRWPAADNALLVRALNEYLRETSSPAGPKSMPPS